MGVVRTRKEEDPFWQATLNGGDGGGEMERRRKRGLESTRSALLLFFGRAHTQVSHKYENEEDGLLFCFISVGFTARRRRRRRRAVNPKGFFYSRRRLRPLTVVVFIVSFRSPLWKGDTLEEDSRKAAAAAVVPPSLLSR